MLYKDWNITRFEINIATEGINLFEIASNSNFFLTDQTSVVEMKKHYGLNGPAGEAGTNSIIDSTDPKSVPQVYTSQSSSLDYTSKDDAEFAMKLESMDKDNVKPNSSELKSMLNDSRKEEERFDEELRRSIQMGNSGAPGNNISGQLKSSDDNSGSIFGN